MGKSQNDENEDEEETFRDGTCFGGSDFDSDNYRPSSILNETLLLNDCHPALNKCERSCLATGHEPCESCALSKQLLMFQEWFPRLGEQNKRICLLGLVQRLAAYPILLQRLCDILAPTTRKDFIYASSKTAPSLQTDTSTISSDRTLTMAFVNKAISMTWNWYEKASILSKGNFIMLVLQSCDVHLLHVVNKFANALLEKQEHDLKIEITKQKNPEDAIPQEYPQISLTDIEAWNQNVPYQEVESRKFMADISNTNLMSQSRQKMKKEEPIMDVERYSVACQYKDFIYCLPTHLAKYILNLLDEVSLTNALKVSQKWRQLTKEVKEDSIVGQQVREEAMILQGSSSHGVNPTYAKDVDVPVPNVRPQTWNVILTDEPVLKTNYRSEANFTVAYSGVSTRKVIMEERNIYCGAYNVMVLQNSENPHRVVHTDGGELIALGSKDRKVRFINSTSGKDVSPLIKGHVGSIKCVFICEKKRIVLSGSYDTSIRCWSVDTGECIRIFRGHRDTVLSLLLLDNSLASGSKDGSCKVWDLETGKCLRTFRHSDPVYAIAISTKLIVSGCNGGKVNVWHKDNGQLIKKLNGHTGPIMSIKFDRWHIVTGSKDGYAMVWSSWGDHAQCLRAFKHPKEVWCVDLAYVRVITGSNDGRIRIWNLLSGQCCRIIRGNSYSDPILHLFPIKNRILVNTHTNLLVLQFEEIEWNYDLENDSLPPLIKYGSYSDVPIQKKTYSYVRAKRMEKVGASNTKILQHQKRGKSCPQQSTRSDKCPGYRNVCYEIQQLNHSARLLSAKCLAKAKLIQQFGIVYNNQKNIGSIRWSNKSAQSFCGVVTDQSSKTDQSDSVSTIKMTDIPENIRTKNDTKVKNTDSSPTSGDHIPSSIQRRLSWAFDKPKEMKEENNTSLLEMKTLLRSQIRAKGELKVPSFVSETMRAYQKGKKYSENSESSECRRRPSSSPSKIDARTKVWINHLQLAQLKDEDNLSANVTDGIAIRNTSTQQIHHRTKKTIISKYIDFFTPPDSKRWTQSATTVPQDWKLQRASTLNPSNNNNDDDSQNLKNRPYTTFELYRDQSRSSVKRISSSAANIREPLKVIPSNKYAEKLARFQEERKAIRLRRLKETQHGKVTPSNNPMRSHINFYLKTHKEEEEEIKKMHESKKESRLL